MDKAWMENEVILGTYGRVAPVRVEKYEECNDDTGIIRPEGSIAIKKAKDYLISEMKAIGLDVYFDNVGNLFGRRHGQKNMKAVATGSHVDTVNNSGQLDGAYGVIAALEVMRRLEKENYQNIRPIEMVVFMGEEGSDFEEALLGSDVLCKKTPPQEAWKQKTHDGRTLKEITYSTCAPIREKDMQADTEFFIESHIEQAGILENEKIPTGAVYAIAGLCHLQIRLTGQENHAGANPMWLRKTPLTPAGAIAVYAHELAAQKANGENPSVATVDTFRVFPNSPSVIPGIVEMTIDIRDNNQASMYEMRDAIIAYAKEQAEKYHVAVEFEQLIDHAPCQLSQEVFDTIMEVSDKADIPCRRMFSGAIHDALNIAQIVKTGMIFVPSKNGISHSPFEWTEWAAQEKGIDLLEASVKLLSARE